MSVGGGSGRGIANPARRGISGLPLARRVNRATAVLAGKDCARQFKAAWERFAGDEANLVEFLNMKRQRR